MPRPIADLEARTIHARLPDPALVIAHHISGKWAIERPDGSDRRYLSLDQAVGVARVLVDRGGHVIPGVPGGRRFDHLLRDDSDLVAAS